MRLPFISIKVIVKLSTPFPTFPHGGRRLHFPPGGNLKGGRL
jgi:hypothetical protein